MFFNIFCRWSATMTDIFTKSPTKKKNFWQTCISYGNIIDFVIVDLFQKIICTIFVFKVKLCQNKKNNLLIPHIIHWLSILFFFHVFKKTRAFAWTRFFKCKTFCTLIFNWKSIWRRICLISYRPNTPIQFKWPLYAFYFVFVCYILWKC